MTHPEWPGSGTAEQDFPPPAYVPPPTYVPPQLDWYRNGPARSRRRSGRAVLWAVVAVVLVAAGVGGWVLYGSGSTSGHPSAAQPPVVAPTSSAPDFPVSSSASTSPAPTVSSRLTEIALHGSDFRTGVTVKLAPDGDRVAGQVTLANCGYRFTSEAHRVARRQYDIRDARGAEIGGNEVVAYDSAAHAAQALSQWYRSGTHCPRGAFENEGTRIVERVSRNQLDVAGLPIATNAVSVQSATSVSVHKTLWAVVVLQVQGRFLDAVYGYDIRPITGGDLDAAFQLATISGQRLAVYAV